MKPVEILAPNQFSIITDNKIIFQSYNTIVCEITNFENGNEPIIKIKEGQPQSATTAKWLNRFLDSHIGVSNYKKVKYGLLP